MLFAGVKVASVTSRYKCYQVGSIPRFVKRSKALSTCSQFFHKEIFRYFLS